MKHLIPLFALILLAMICPSRALAQAAAVGPVEGAVEPEPKADFAWGQAEYVFVGKLTSVVPGPVAMSMPPIYNYTLIMTIETALRGDIKAGEKLSTHYAAHQEKEPVFPLNKSCIFAASRERGAFRIERLAESTPKLVDEVTAACLMPLGWTMKDGKPASPWAGLGGKAWPADAKDPAAKLVCAVTGRPAYLAGEVSFDVEKVPPAKDIQWTNPDGDGEYKITVTNKGEKPVSVPALLSADGKVLWEESLIIVCQKKAYVCPGCKGVSGKVGPTVLQGGQSVSTIVNVLRLKGPEWPQGGYRIEFQFGLGEKSRTMSFYYMARHHDALREAAQKIQ